MQFKLLLALAAEERIDAILAAARAAGATGATVITSARGEGLARRKTFLGLDLAARRDVVLLVVEEHLSRTILEAVAAAGGFAGESGAGIVLQLAVEDAIGLEAQIEALGRRVGDRL